MLRGQTRRAAERCKLVSAAIARGEGPNLALP